MNQYVKFFRKRIIDACFKNPVAKVATTLPTRKGSAAAAVLADLLSGCVLNGVDMADEIHSSRLKDHISTLRHRHGWTTIDSSQIAKATKDGRVQWVKQYWLPIETLVGALRQLRGNQQQHIVVQHVNVSAGGQAMVGTVNTMGGQP